MVNQLHPMGINFLFQKEVSVLAVVDSIGPLQIRFGLKNKHRKSGLGLSAAGPSKESPAKRASFYGAESLPQHPEPGCSPG